MEKWVVLICVLLAGVHASCYDPSLALEQMRMAATAYRPIC